LHTFVHLYIFFNLNDFFNSLKRFVINFFYGTILFYRRCTCLASEHINLEVINLFDTHYLGLLSLTPSKDNISKYLTTTVH